MITINVIDDKISGSYGDTPFSVPFERETHTLMYDLAEKANNATTMEEYQGILDEFSKLTVVDYTKTVETECKHIHINKATGEFFLKNNGIISSIPMPKALVDRIFESMDKGLSFEPLIKMWTRWLRNPYVKSKGGTDFSERFFNFVNMKYVHPKLMKASIALIRSIILDVLGSCISALT